MNQKLDNTHNKETGFELFMLPKTVMTQLLYPLLDPTMQDKLQQLNAEFKEIIDNNTLWQEFIDRYFPYARNKKAYMTSPKVLFLKQFQQFKHFKIPHFSKDQTMQFVLNSLCGDLEAINKAILSHAAKQVFYVIAAANGHKGAHAHLDDNGMMEAFKRAAAIGNEKCVIWFLEHKHMTIKSLEQSLELAAQHGHVTVVALLLQQQGSIAQDAKGQALRNAAIWGRATVTQILLEQCQQDIPAGYFGRAFEDAAEKGHWKVIEAILNSHIEINPNYIGRAFNLAAQFGHGAVIEFMLQKCLKDISYVDKGSALNYAAEIGADDIVKTLLQEVGADIDNVDKESALTLAASKGYLGVVQTILAAVGNEINADDKEQALQIAQNYGHGSVVKAFKQYNLGHAFKDAAAFGQVEMVQWLLDQAGSDIASSYKGLALEGAAKNGYADVVEVLLTQVPHEIDEYHFNRAKQFAQEQGYDTLVKLLQTNTIKRMIN